MKAFLNARIVPADGTVRRANLLFDEKIAGIGAGADGAEIISLDEDLTVLPGFVDVHIHGAGGADTMDGTPEALATIAKTVAKEGTTSFLATTMTQDAAIIETALANVRKYMKDREKPTVGARVVGVNLEGPFICRKFCGAQDPAAIAAPDASLFDRFMQVSGNAIRLATFASEEEGMIELIAHARSLGVIPSVGHSNATFSDVRRAMVAGAASVTHTYNAQSPLHHREVGIVGSAMLLDSLYSELIADTIHVSVPAIQLLLKCKPHDKVVLITDAMRAKGVGDGISDLGGQKVIVHGGEARLENGALAGSVLCMNRALENIVRKIGLPIEEAVDFCTKNPARLIGMEKEIGSIEVGKRADFTVIDRDFNVVLTVRGGEIIYDAR